MTPVQARMARAALDLSIEALAAEAALPADVVERIEHDGGQRDAASRLRSAFERAGVEFLGDDGVRWRSRDDRASHTLPLDELNAANDE